MTASADPAAVAGRLREHLDAAFEEMLDDVATLVGLESPSGDLAALREASDWLERWLAPVGSVAPVEVDGHRHLLVETPGARERGVLLMCHYDTVWPAGTTAEWPFAVDGDNVSGPGVLDMKASIVCARHALLALRSLGLACNARLLITADEETGNRTSRALIAAEARRAIAALVLEPPLADGSLKTARKGHGHARIVATGRAAHAGVAPQDGVNAIEELARVVGEVRAIADGLPGVSATVGRIEGGGAVNVVPERAEMAIDLRAWTGADMAALRTQLMGLRPHLPGAELDVEVLIERPPMERTPSTERLFTRASDAARGAGLTLTEASTGGCSEGNLVQAAGVATLDGLGVRGHGPHTREERIELANVVPQAALVGALAHDLGSGERV
jgi:glutamate carboxypeptidase